MTIYPYKAQQSKVGMSERWFRSGFASLSPCTQFLSGKFFRPETAYKPAETFFFLKNFLEHTKCNKQ